VTRALLPLLLLLLLPAAAPAYPVDGYGYTGIRRLEQARLVQSGEISGRRRLPGQYLPMAEINPRWRASDGAVLPPVDAELSREIANLVPAAQREDYAIVVLDLSDPQNPVYATHQPDMQANAGSVGKILVALALFQKLADLYPDDISRRERVLRDTRITADAFSQYDQRTHTVPFWDLERKRNTSRLIGIGDQASLWEFLDWMLSASSNSAASMVQKELIALTRFGPRYPVSAEEEAEFFATTPRLELGRLMTETMTDALVRNGLAPEKIRQGSFFTRGGNQRVSSTTSYATPEQLVKILFRLEAGTLVDRFSSRELKRLLYMTQRRIRYASHPALNDAAVYFKSGSFYQCHSSCGRYKGDKTNRLASVAIIESAVTAPAAVPAAPSREFPAVTSVGELVIAAITPAAAPAQLYLVAVMSNVLRVNSAVAHQTLAMRIHRLIAARHPLPQAPAPVPESSYPSVPVDDSDAADAPGPGP
jgi:hypothetical protein